MRRTVATDAPTLYGPGRAAATAKSAPAGARPWGRRAGPRRRTRLAALVPLLAAAWLGACSAPLEVDDDPVFAAPPPTLRADQARLYFYRPNDSLFPAIRPPVIINGRKVGISVVGEAFYRDARPGRYVIFLADDDDDRLTVDLAPGEVHYVRTSIAMTWLGPNLSPRSVAADQGERELQSVLLVEPRLDD